MISNKLAGDSVSESKLAVDISNGSSSEQVSEWELVLGGPRSSLGQSIRLTSEDQQIAPALQAVAKTDLLPNGIYLLFNAPARSDGYHRGIFVTSSFKVGEDLPSGTLFHAIYAKRVFIWTKECWRLVRRSVSNIRDFKSLTLAYRIGEILGAPTEIADQFYQLEKILKRVKLEATPERMEKSFLRPWVGYSSRVWTEDALCALVNEMLPETFLLSMNLNPNRTEKIKPDVIIAEANLARHLAEVECVPGKLVVFN